MTPKVGDNGTRRLVTGQRLALLLETTRDAFLRALDLRQLSKEYLRQSQFITDSFAAFCATHAGGEPWQLREEYLAWRTERRSQQPYSPTHLARHRPVLRRFLRWYLQRVAVGAVVFGQLSAQQVDAYWSTQETAALLEKPLLAKHLQPLLTWLQQNRDTHRDEDVMVHDYLENRRQKRRGRGYGQILTRRAQVVTRRHLLWLELEGHLPAGTAPPAVRQKMVEWATSDLEATHLYFTTRVDVDLPPGLRQPLLDFVDHLVHERQLAKGSIRSAFRPVLTLCRYLAEERHASFAVLRTTHIDNVVSSLVSAPPGDLLRRRQQICTQHHNLRGFLRYLFHRGALKRDLASAVISPPWYEASKPPSAILPENQIQSALESIDCRDARGRRCHAILLLTATYGLRPIDVSQLGLDDLHWRQEKITLVQQKTNQPVELPLVSAVARALHDYLHQDRPVELHHRRVFVSLLQPHKPLGAMAISNLVATALKKVNVRSNGARRLRSSVATHLLRQGVPLSTIQEVLGHSSVESTQRYAVADVEILRQVLDRSER